MDCVVQSGDAATFLLISAGKQGELFSEVGEGSSAGFFPPYCANILLCTLYFFLWRKRLSVLRCYVTACVGMCK